MKKDEINGNVICLVGIKTKVWDKLDLVLAEDKRQGTAAFLNSSYREDECAC